METQKQGHEVIQDLALIYIALAHGADEQLDDVEVDAIAERLRNWQNGASKTVLSALKEAMEGYVQDGAEERVNEAIRVVAEQLPKDQRQRILDDLTEVAMADGKFLYDEGSFIGDLARAWDVHATDRALENGNGGWWSVLDDNGNRDGSWTTLHHLALVYVTLAHGTDRDLSTQEVGAITEKLTEWVPDAESDDMLQVVQDVLTAYAQGPDRRLFEESEDVLRKCVPKHQREALLGDLRYIAASDGVVLDEERRMIDRLSDAWGMMEA